MINVLTGLSEANSNVTNHAYPAEYQPDYPHVGRLWVSATADRHDNSLNGRCIRSGYNDPDHRPSYQPARGGDELPRSDIEADRHI